MVFSIELGLIILFSILGGVLAVRFKQPSVLGLLIIGAIVGPYSLGFIKDTSLIEASIEIGAILLLFTIGIEFSLEHLFNYGIRAIIIAAIKLGSVFLVGYLIAIIFNLGVLSALYIGVILSITSTVIVVKILEQKGMSKREELPLLITILILEDIFGIFALAFFSSLNTKAELAPINLFTKLIISLAIMAIFFAILKRLLKPVIGWLVKYSTEDTITFTSIGLCAGMSYIAYLIGLSPSVGAFLAGNSVSSLPNSKIFEKSIHPFILTFTALFFFSIGTIVNLKVILSSIYLIAILFVVNIFMKFFSIGFGSYLLSNFKGKQAVFSGIAMLSVGEFSLLIAREAESAGLGIELVDITAALIIFSTIAMTLIINYTGTIYSIISRFSSSHVIEDIGLARNYFNNISWLMSKDRLSMNRINVEWKSILNNLLALFFISATGFIVWHFFKDIVTSFLVNKIFIYLVAGFFVVAVLFPTYNIVRRTSLLFEHISIFFIKLYPREIANEKKILRNLIILGVLFALSIVIPNLLIFLRLKPVYHFISVGIIFGFLVYFIKELNLIHILSEKHKTNMNKLSNQFQSIFKKRIKQRLVASPIGEKSKFKEVTYHPSKIIYLSIMILLLFFGGSFVYYYLEKLTFIDAMYLAASTLTRVGYGDIVPKTDSGRLFTIFYMFFAVGVVIYGLLIIAKFFFERKK